MSQSFPQALLEVIPPEDLHYRPARRALTQAEAALLATIAARSVLIQPFWAKLANATVIGDCTHGCPCLLLELGEPDMAPHHSTSASGWAQVGPAADCEFEFELWNGRFAALEFRTAIGDAVTLPLPESVRIYDDPVSG